uniref:Uncharacterized protein n=1 Tax=Leersia perrieri TaxID=77586 RepID=A0A0D9VL01_9ORYZ
MAIGAPSDELLGTFVPIAVYWLYSGLYLALEGVERLDVYRLHPRAEETAKNVVSRGTVVRGVLVQQAFQVAVSLTLFAVIGDESGAEQKQPSALVILLQFAIAMFVMDTWQYFMHRYMHINKFLYKHIHSKHHTLVVPYSFGALYNHPLEGLILDTIGGALSFLVSGMTPRTSIFFFSFATIKTVDDHCGLWLPGNILHALFNNNSAYHDIHHQLYGNKYNFSQPFFVMWDKILGTYMPYSIEHRKGGGFESRPVKLNITEQTKILHYTCGMIRAKCLRVIYTTHLNFTRREQEAISSTLQPPLRVAGTSAAGMPERRLPISTPAAAGPRRHPHPRRLRRRCRLLLFPAFALALVSLAYLSFSSHPNLPFHDVPCQIEFLPSVDDLVEPGIYNNFTGFSLNYILEENVSPSNGHFEPLFGGHQNLQEREETYYARNQTLHCGFVQGPEGYPNTGFDLDENDKMYMASCRVVVSSCIFGSSDYLRKPTKSKIGPYSKKNVCFIMFLDELTLGTLSSEGIVPDETRSIGLWRIVVVKKSPYKDMRRAGKVPKLLAHRLFPSAIKLRLNADPMLIIEYFLWRKKAEYAISMHYDRTCVWEEVLQNKRLNKYNHTAIDEQFYFYQSDGLLKFNESGKEPVNRFTSRDQLSFSYTYLKLRRMNSGKPFHLNMFKDCERRAITKLFHHRANETADPPTANP